jgi:3alpha(or 20beta)-hydroxysteroid dehydrogenase
MASVASIKTLQFISFRARSSHDRPLGSPPRPSWPIAADTPGAARKVGGKPLFLAADRPVFGVAKPAILALIYSCYIFTIVMIFFFERGRADGRNQRLPYGDKGLGNLAALGDRPSSGTTDAGRLEPRPAMAKQSKEPQAGRKTKGRETMGRFSGKVAIITGAASGQGAAEARLFISDGAKVVLTDVSEGGAELARELGDSAFFVRLDVSDEAAWSQVVAAALDRFGRVDILVNNAGVFSPVALRDTDRQTWELNYKVNQLGVFLGMKAVIEPMIAAGGGSIVNISSLTAQRGVTGMFAYASTKWAVRGMTKCAALDLAPFGIRVNTVLPGVIDTPMQRINGEKHMAEIATQIPAKRLGTAEEVARLVAFVASDEAGYMNGSELTIDGGMFA